jgi:hypothetical protein
MAEKLLDIASMLVLIEPWPVSMIISASGCLVLILFRVSRPSIPGIATSGSI